jgi:hypothetical protein
MNIRVQIDWANVLQLAVKSHDLSQAETNIIIVTSLASEKSRHFWVKIVVILWI